MIILWLKQPISYWWKLGMFRIGILVKYFCSVLPRFSHNLVLFKTVLLNHWRFACLTHTPAIPGDPLLTLRALMATGRILHPQTSSSQTLAAGMVKRAFYQTPSKRNFWEGGWRWWSCDELEINNRSWKLCGPWIGIQAWVVKEQKKWGFNKTMSGSGLKRNVTDHLLLSGAIP